MLCVAVVWPQMPHRRIPSKSAQKRLPTFYGSRLSFYVQSQNKHPAPFHLEISSFLTFLSPKQDRPQNQQIPSSRVHHWLILPQVPIYVAKVQAST